MDPHVRLKLMTGIRVWDERQKAKGLKRGRGFYNPHAFAMYCRGLTELEASVDAGMSLADALAELFTGRLLSHLERSVGLPVS